MQKTQSKISTKDLVFTALSIALITMGAYMRITLFVIPFTLQLAFVMLVALVFGHKVGFLSTGIYTLMGLLGIPLFSKGGGLGYIASPSFGYILGFILCAVVMGYFAGPNKIKGSKKLILAKTFGISLFGLLTVYFIGVSYWYLLDLIMIKSGSGFFNIAYKGAVMFIPKDVFLCLIVSTVSPRLRSLSSKASSN